MTTATATKGTKGTKGNQTTKEEMTMTTTKTKRTREERKAARQQRYHEIVRDEAIRSWLDRAIEDARQERIELKGGDWSIVARALRNKVETAGLVVYRARKVKAVRPQVPETVQMGDVITIEITSGQKKGEQVTGRFARVRKNGAAEVLEVKTNKYYSGWFASIER